MKHLEGLKKEEREAIIEEVTDRMNKEQMDKILTQVFDYWKLIYGRTKTVSPRRVMKTRDSATNEYVKKTLTGFMKYMEKQNAMKCAVENLYRLERKWMDEVNVQKVLGDQYEQWGIGDLKEWDKKNPTLFKKM